MLSQEMVTIVWTSTNAQRSNTIVLLDSHAKISLEAINAASRVSLERDWQTMTYLVQILMSVTLELTSVLSYVSILLVVTDATVRTDFR